MFLSRSAKIWLKSLFDCVECLSLTLFYNEKLPTLEIRSGAYTGSGWENQDRWSARYQPIRFKDLGLRTAEKLEKKINVVINRNSTEIAKLYLLLHGSDQKQAAIEFITNRT